MRKKLADNHGAHLAYYQPGSDLVFVSQLAALPAKELPPLDVRVHVCMYVWCVQVYALGRDTSVVFLLQLGKEGASVQSVESFSATSKSLDVVFIVRGEFGKYELKKLNAWTAEGLPDTHG